MHKLSVLITRNRLKAPYFNKGDKSNRAEPQVLFDCNNVVQRRGNSTNQAPFSFSKMESNINIVPRLNHAFHALAKRTGLDGDWLLLLRLRIIDLLFNCFTVLDLLATISLVCRRSQQALLGIPVHWVVYESSNQLNSSAMFQKLLIAFWYGMRKQYVKYNISGAA